MKSIVSLILLWFCTLSASLAQTYTVETIPNVHIQNKYQFVSNPDSIISTETVAEIDRLLYDLEQKTSAEVAVILVNSIGKTEIKPFATQLFEAWGIGKRAKDNGLLVLFVADQRKITFETGYGVEGILPDAICKRIQMQRMLPAFKSGDYNAGMLAGIKAIHGIFTQPDAVSELWAGPSPERVQSQSSSPLSGTVLIYLLISLFVTLLFAFMVRGALRSSFDKSAYSRYRSLKPYRGITLMLSFIFPLGMIFIYLWVKIKLYRLRNVRQVCDQCGSSMEKLDEEEDDLYLSAAEITEEHLNSVDYDVWLCKQCGAKKIYPYENQFTAYSVCPQCKAKAYALESDRILSAATPFSAGVGEKVYSCAACRHRARNRYSIPMIVMPPVHRGNGGGGFGGGSFGGGRSGGGGSTSGW